MDNSSLPLVSVCVISYNSEKTIVETLDSIYAQSYENLELVISDDHSSDDSVSVCRRWLECHESRFTNSVLIVKNNNGGVAANLNTAVAAARGEWLKTIAADDLLLPDCIKDNLNFVFHNDNQGIVFSKILPFRTEGGANILVDYNMPSRSAIPCYSLPAKEQYERILVRCFTPSNSAFFKKSLLEEFSFPEQYPFNEDDPLWLRMTKTGIQLCYFDKATVMYRLGDTLSHTGEKSFVNSRYHYSKMAYFYTDRFFPLTKIDPAAAAQLQKEFFLGDIAIILLKNRRNFFTKAVLFFFKILVGTRKIQ